ncbi:MAG: YicC family protein [Clostridium sp.]|nr:YicC family protein [Clostridium sp.]
MLYSMTGFGRAVAETNGKKIVVEIKSLNSKQMDLTLRVPQSLRELEPELRAMASSALERGKADMIAAIETPGTAACTQFNIEAVKAYKQQILEIASEAGLPEPTDWYSVLLRFPEVTHAEATVAEASQEEASTVMQTAKKAIDALMEYRAAEGKKLEEFFAIRIKAISELLAKVPQYEEARVAQIKDRIYENLSKLNQVEFDRGRFEQEMIYYIEKLDINEEKQRLKQHLAYFMETMALPHPGQGKKLGFISQEMGREINTLGSKSNHAEMQKLVVMMKDALEQIKEQVLNVM